jgi:hypothetical protein
MLVYVNANYPTLFMQQLHWQNGSRGLWNNWTESPVRAHGLLGGENPIDGCFPDTELSGDDCPRNPFWRSAVIRKKSATFRGKPMI